MESYILKSNLALASFYILYKLVVYYKISHQFKRMVGIGIVLFCTFFLMIPSFQLSPSSSYSPGVKKLIETASTLDSTMAISMPEEHVSTFMVIYLTGVAFFSLRFLIGVSGLIKLYIQSTKKKSWGFNLVETPDPISPFSFFNFLFIHKGDASKSGLEPIVLHEQVHRDQYHSLDVILMEALSIFYWCNPFIWLLKKDIKASHEFIADEFVINKGFDKLAYQDLLFKERTGVSYRAVSYLSNQLSLKQRFNIMEKSKINLKNSYMRAGIVLVAMALTVSISSFRTITTSSESMGAEPNVIVTTKDGKVDLEKGIPFSTKIIFVKLVPNGNEADELQITKMETTLISEGQGLATMETEGSVIVKNLLSRSEEEKNNMLLLEIKQYRTKDKQGIIERVIPDKPIFLRIPVY
ncbi:MAG: M56 family metallopeptidase [Ekhidna sp.]